MQLIRGSSKPLYRNELIHAGANLAYTVLNPCPQKILEKTMKSYKLITALLLLAPAAVWAGDVTEKAKGVAGAVLDFVVPPASAAVPEPSILPLLAVGGVVAVAVKFMRRKK